MIIAEKFMRCLATNDRNRLSTQMGFGSEIKHTVLSNIELNDLLIIIS